MNGKIGLIFNGVWSHYAVATAPKYARIYEMIYVHGLPESDLSEFDALVVPFQSNLNSLVNHRPILESFLATGKTIAWFGDCSATWPEATWADRPVNNYWWVENPQRPPISKTDPSHPVFAGLLPRHACWHTHGVYTALPEGACAIQTNLEDETITWEWKRNGGTLFASTLDPIVEHGVQQIRHLDHFVDSLTHWLCQVRPEGRFTLNPESYGVSTWK